MFFSQYITTIFGRCVLYSRHHTLQPLGVSLLIVGIFSLLSKWSTKAEKQLRVFVVAICVFFNAVFGFEYLTDYAKQKEVISELIETGQGKYGVNVEFLDQTALLNARGRRFRTRDWQGLIWSAYGVETSQASRVTTICDSLKDSRLVLIEGPETHWDALKNWVSDGDMGFEVTVDDTPGACKPEMVKSQQSSGAIPILFYFTGAKG